MEVNASNTERGRCTSSSSESLKIVDKKLTVSITEGNVVTTDSITNSFRYDFLAEDLQLCQLISLLQHVKSRNLATEYERPGGGGGNTPISQQADFQFFPTSAKNSGISSTLRCSLVLRAEKPMLSHPNRGRYVNNTQAPGGSQRQARHRASFH
jgi:hypothetical protein